MAEFRRDHKPRSSGRDAKRSSGRFGGSESGRFGDRYSRRSSDREEGGFGGRGERRSRDSPVEMHEVICDKCGEKCEVPFKPTSSKPVYCSDCFRKNKDSDSRSSGPSRGNDDISAELAKINKKLDQIIAALELEE